MTDQRDTLYADSYADPVAAAGLFSFDANVASVFPDMIKRSVPGHRQRIAATGFSSCDVWFQCFNFASLIALK